MKGMIDESNSYIQELETAISNIQSKYNAEDLERKKKMDQLIEEETNQA